MLPGRASSFGAGANVATVLCYFPPALSHVRSEVVYMRAPCCRRQQQLLDYVLLNIFVRLPYLAVPLFTVATNSADNERRVGEETRYICHPLSSTH